MSEGHEIHMFSAVAEAGADCAYPNGERHPLLIFVRQAPGHAHDMGAAAAAATREGWIEVDITRAGTLPFDASDSMEPRVLEAYRRAVRNVTGMVVFEAVVKPAPRKG